MTRSFSNIEATDRLLATNPFDFRDMGRQLFIESFRETALKHFDGNAVFRAFWHDAGLHPRDITDEAALLRVPPLMVHLFKERELCSVPREEVVLTLTSSGTGGQRSQMFLNQRSLSRVRHLALEIHRALGLTSTDEVNYLCFTYDPAVAKDLGTAFTDELLTSFTSRHSVYYTFQWNEQKQDFAFNEQGVLDTLLRFEREGKPVRILGFPAFLFKLIKDHDLKLDLGARSWVQTGGGWKGLAAEEIPKAEFRAFVAQRLGIPMGNIRDLFGMVEHGIPYVDCHLGNMHIPNFARVFTRSADGARILPDGERGLLQLMCTYNDSYPAMALLTTDWGRVGQCGCEIGGPTLELLGRAGVSKHKGCAVKALEML